MGQSKALGPKYFQTDSKQVISNSEPERGAWQEGIADAYFAYFCSDRRTGCKGITLGILCPSFC